MSCYSSRFFPFFYPAYPRAVRKAQYCGAEAGSFAAFRAQAVRTRRLSQVPLDTLLLVVNHAVANAHAVAPIIGTVTIIVRSL